MLKQNLGQNAYVEYDGWATIITTNNNSIYTGSHEVTLTPTQVVHLVKFLYFVQTAKTAFPSIDLKKSKTSKTSSK